MPATQQRGPSLAQRAARIRASRKPTVPIDYKDWMGSMRSRSADTVPREYAAGSLDVTGSAAKNFRYVPRRKSWRRRDGQTQKFDTFGASVGLLPAKWGGKARWSEEFTSEAISDNVPTISALYTKEVATAGLDDGRFAQLWLRDQVNNLNYTVGDEFGAATYPAAPQVQSYKIVPLWSDSGDGLITRGIDEFRRRFFFSGSRRYQKVGNWWYFPDINGTPCRWRGRFTPAGAVAASVAHNYGRPTGISGAVGNWRNQAGSSVNIWNTLDEAVQDNADYITEVPTGTSGTGLTITLWAAGAAGFTPPAGATATFRIAVRRTVLSGGATTEQFSFSIYSGATLVKTVTQAVTNSSYGAPIQVILSAAEYALIDVALSLTIDIATVGFGNFQVYHEVSWVELDFSNPSTLLANANRLIPSGPISPTHAGTMRAVDVVPDGPFHGSYRWAFSVAYRFEDGSIWAPCPARLPNDLLTNGFNIFTVDASDPTKRYRRVLWENIPRGPHGTTGRVLLRSLTVDILEDDPLQLVVGDWRIVDELKDNTTTTYEMTLADDASLQSKEISELLIYRGYVMPPPGRYIFGGDSRVCHAYGRPKNPCALTLAPVGNATAYDLNVDDEGAAGYANTFSFQVRHDDAGVLNRLTLRGPAGDTIVNLNTDDTLQKVVDRINANDSFLNGGVWRAQMCPGIEPSSSSVDTLAPHLLIILACTSNNGSPLITKAAGGLSRVPVGAYVQGGGVWTAGTYVLRIVSDTQLLMSANAGGGTPTTTDTVFFNDTEGNLDSFQRVTCNALPAFVYFNKRHIEKTPIEKSSVWMTVASPGQVKSAANNFSGRYANKHTPPLEAGIATGGGAVDQGFVVFFSKKRGAIRNTRDMGTGEDTDYRLFITNETSGVPAWNTVCSGNRFVVGLAPEGLMACDLFNEVLITPFIYLHAAPAVGDFVYELPLCIAAAAADSDGAYASARIARGSLWVSYRASGAHPNRVVEFDFASGATGEPGSNSGLMSLFRPGTRDLWGWSYPLVRSVTSIVEGRRGDGAHLYGFNDENAGSNGDGRVDELEVTDQDNGSNIVGSVELPWERAGGVDRVSAQEIACDHSSPSSSTGFLDFHRSFSDVLYALTLTTGSSVVVTSDLSQLPQPARVATEACYIGFRQLTGSARELRRVVLSLKKVRGYK